MAQKKSKAKVLCMASAKGGTGKTVLTASLGTFLSALGKKTLIIDMDPATHGLSLLYIKELRSHADAARREGRDPVGFFRAAASYGDPEIVRLTRGPDLLPASYDFRVAELPELDALRRGVQRIVDRFRGQYDFIFVDAQAGAMIASRVAMSSGLSDEVVIVTEYDPVSAAGVECLKGLMSDDLTFVRTWILLNKMLPEFTQRFSEFLEVAKYLPPIPWDASVVRAFSKRKLALDLERGNEYTLAVMQTLKSLLGDEVSSDIAQWAADRASSIREPVEQQYQDAEQELRGLLDQRRELGAATFRSWFLRASIATGVAASLLVAAFSAYHYLQKGTRYLESLPEMLRFMVGMMAGIGVLFVLSLVVSRHLRKRGVGIEERRLHRQINLLEERLKRLEVLRAGDLETLIKFKSNNGMPCSGLRIRK